MINVRELPRGITGAARHDKRCFDSAPCTLCKCGTLCFQINCSMHTNIPYTQAISVTINFRLLQFAFGAAQLHLDYFALIDLGVGLRQRRHYEEK